MVAARLTLPACGTAPRFAVLRTWRWRPFVRIVDTSSGTHVHEAGRVTVWQPPARLVFTWRNANFAAEESTEVKVLFEPTNTGTRVTVQHRGWSAIRPGHPARHGVEGAAFSRMIGLWWGELMTALREFIETRGAE